MANKRKVLGILALALVFAVALTGCATIEGYNSGTFKNINVPAKDFTALGIVQTVVQNQNNQGEVFTYHSLLALAKELGADTITNVVIDSKYEGTKLGFLKLSQAWTYYGSATAVKYVDGTLENTATTTVVTSAEGTTTKTDTKNEVLMFNAEAPSSGAAGLFGGSGSSSGKKWYNPFTWFN